MKLLLLSPHIDDEFLELPIYFYWQKKSPVEVRIVSFSACEQTAQQLGLPKDTLREEEKDALQKIGISWQKVSFYNFPVRCFSDHRQEILEEIVLIKKDFQPDMVLCPSSKDVHQDHQVVFQEAIRCFKNSATILGYIYPWNVFSAHINFHLEIDESIFQKIMTFLHSYPSQKHKTYLQESYLRSLFTVYGNVVGKPLAIGYEIIRMIQKL